jgi:hypothetical protein
LEVSMTTAVPAQLPLTPQASVAVQALPSSQLVPTGFAGFEQLPVCGSQTPALWQASLATQTRALPPTHAPDWQASVCVHASPSLQAAPSALTGFEQAPVTGSQVPVP